MWVICAGMMRAGSTVQYQFARDLLESTEAGRALGYCSADEFEILRTRMPATIGLKVVKCHEWIPWEILAPADERRILYIYRDLRDSVVSWMHKAGISFDAVMTSGYLEDLIENDFLWTRSRDVLVSRYETLVDDLAGEVRRIAGHLGIPVDDERVDYLAGKYGIERQRQRIHAIDFERDGVRVGGHVLFDRESLLHHNHIRTGRAGQWRDELTPAQIAVLEEIAGGWLTEHGYPLSQTLSDAALASLP